MKIGIIRASGKVELHEVEDADYLGWIRRAINAAALDCVNLRDRRTMAVDDTGFVDGRPRNEQATALYHGVCAPGTTFPICGDVAVIGRR